MYDDSQIINGCRPMTAGDGNLPSTAVPSVRPRPASKKTAAFRPSSGRTGLLTTLWSQAE